MATTLAKVTPSSPWEALTRPRRPSTDCTEPTCSARLSRWISPSLAVEEEDAEAVEDTEEEEAVEDTEVEEDAEAVEDTEEEEA